MIENRVFGTIERVWFEYRFGGEEYFQVHHLVSVEDRVLMITLQVLATMCDDDLLKKAMAFANSLEPYQWTVELMDPLTRETISLEGVWQV